MNFFISWPAGKLANRTGMGFPECGGVPHFCGQETRTYTFSFIAAPGQMPPGFFAGDFYLTGSVEYASNSPCFRSVGKVDAAAQSVTFEVDTYTEQYLHNVTRPWMTMYCDITHRAPGESNDVRLCNFSALADPRVYIPGVPPSPVESYYTSEEVNQLFVQTVKHADVLPAPSAALEGAVYVYTGPDGEFASGQLYICQQFGGDYVWLNYGGTGGSGESAGFGKVTAVAESVAAGQPASAKVTASGPDNAKNFLFEFAIPQGQPGAKGDPGEKGDKGDPGEPGKDGYTPKKGVDYYTASDKEDLLNELEGKLLAGEWGTV